MCGVCVCVFVAGRFVGDFGGLLPRRSTTSVRTTQPLQAFVFDKQKLVELCKQKPSLAVVWTTITSNEMTAKMKGVCVVVVVVVVEARSVGGISH